MEDLECLIFYIWVNDVFKDRTVHCRYRIYTLRDALSIRNGREYSLYPCLHVIDVEISDNYHCLKVRTIPLLIEVKDLLPLEAVDDLIFSDDISFGVL